MSNACEIRRRSSSMPRSIPRDARTNNGHGRLSFSAGSTRQHRDLSRLLVSHKPGVRSRPRWLLLGSRRSSSRPRNQRPCHVDCRRLDADARDGLTNQTAIVVSAVVALAATWVGFGVVSVRVCVPLDAPFPPHPASITTQTNPIPASQRRRRISVMITQPNLVIGLELR